MEIVETSEKGELVLGGRPLFADYSSKAPAQPTHELLLSSNQVGSLTVTKIKKAFQAFRDDIKDIRSSTHCYPRPSPILYADVVNNTATTKFDASRYFITFKDADIATRAQKEMNGKNIGDEPVFLVYARPRKSLA
jgi:hypothetical protein